ncbi:hypothetical protein PsorP6_005484 [Peronosclerospora sorghi]|uniref:Uncharacterized protein n=1 Tax=Peronosclerospora sorghi TaxID=230839 RepID=A0ACC0W2Y2_9STRA|nr:hypothetical protein PsorP6_005484 [Peronosclerospora sorghi]
MSITPKAAYAETLQTPDADYTRDAARRLDVSPSGTENHKQAHETGDPVVTFFKWRMTRPQRRWLVAGLVLVFLVVALLLVFIAIVPAVMQHYVHAVDLSLNYLDVQSIPSASTLHVELSLTVHHDVALSVTTEDTPVFLHYDGHEFGSIVMPGLDLHTGEQKYNLTVTGLLTLSNLDVFNVLAKELVEDRVLSLEATATFKAHTMGLTYGGLDLERTLELHGLNLFRDPRPKIESINWFGCSHETYEMDINVTLTNPSSMGLNGIGPLNLSLYYGDSYLGYAESLTPTLGLPRGESHQLFRATIPTASKTLKSMALGFLGGNASFSITGTNPYATLYTQFQEAIRTVNMTVVYTDGLAKLSLNKSCNLLSLLM